jgi:hypothetical protein
MIRDVTTAAMQSTCLLAAICREDWVGRTRRATGNRDELEARRCSAAMVHASATT